MKHWFGCNLITLNFHVAKYRTCCCKCSLGTAVELWIQPHCKSSHLTVGITKSRASSRLLLLMEREECLMRMNCLLKVLVAVSWPQVVKMTCLD